MGKKTHGPILVAAIEHNDFEKVREVLLTHIKSKQKIQELCTSEVRRMAAEYTEVPLLLAATLPDPTIIQFLVLKQDVNINYVHKEVARRKTKVKTALILAVRSGLVNTVDAILAMNADPNLQDHKLRTALHHAVRKADYRMAKMLLTRGAQPNIVDAAGNTPLHIATIFGHTELVKLLVKHDSDMFKKGTSGAIPIHMAAKEGHNALVRLFCEYDVNVNTKVPCYDNREKAPIHVAAEEGHAETVAVLLHDCGADPNIRDSMGETPLHCACLREYDPMGMKSKDEYTETVRVLLNSGAHIDLQNSRGETPLHLATRNEFQKTVELLIQAGSDPTIEDNGGYKPYDLATADDTVTIQILKSAMEERTRIMNDALEVQAKGYSTALIKPSVTSRSALSVASIGSNEFILASGGRNGSSAAMYEDGYLKPVGLRSRSNTKASSLTGSSQGSSSGGSKAAFSRGQKKSQSLLPQFRVKGSKPSLRGLDRSAGSNPDLSGKDAGACPPSPSRSLPKPPVVQMRDDGVTERRTGAEVDSFWDVTPHTSTSTTYDDQQTEPGNQLQKSYESLPNNDLTTAAPAGNKVKGTRQPRQTAGGKRTIEIKAAFPNANKIPTAQLNNGTTVSDDDDDTYYDDESFDTLDTLSDKGAPPIPPKPSKSAVNQRGVPYTPEEKRKIQNAVSNQSLHSWLEEQADIIQKEGLPEPPAMKQVSHDVNDECSTMSEFSSVSKTHLRQANRNDMPPPLPPKPGSRPKPPKLQHQQLEPAPQARTQEATQQTVIKVVPRDTNLKSSVSESTSYTASSQPYGTGYYDSLNSGVEESDSVVTESTVVGPAGSRSQHHTRQQNKNLRTFKAPGSNVAASSTTNEESSDNPTWERVPVNPSSNLYWQHTGSTEGIFAARKENRQKPTVGKRLPYNQPQETNEDDSSDSLSWRSSEDEDDEETTVISHQAASSVLTDKITQLRQDLESQLGKSLAANERRLNKSMGDIQNEANRQALGRMGRKLSEGQSLSSVTRSGYAREEQRQNRLNSNSSRGQASSSGKNMARSESVEVIDVRRNATVARHRSMRRALSNDDLDSVEDDEFDDSSILDQRKVTIGNDVIIPDRTKGDRSPPEENRIVLYDADGKPPKLVGGNVTGVFIHQIDKKSKTIDHGLNVGDKILKLNGRSVRGLTREEVYSLLKAAKTSITLVVRSDPDEYQKVVSQGGSGDSFHIRTHFTYDAASKSELSFRSGEVFYVKDTMPNGKFGLWHVVKVTYDQGREEAGFIPNKFKADQIATSYRIAELRAAEVRNKGGSFRKGFKRAKSLDRGMNKADGDDFHEAIKDVKSYERVRQQMPEFKRPVVLLGLFCDSVRDLLIEDQPDRFALAKGAVELSTNTPNDPAVPPVNVRPIEVVAQQGKHCLLIMTPSNIRYLQDNTQLNPIVIYLCPANKTIVKSLKARFAPGFERKASFMYEEAIQFSKRHSYLFSATIYYTNDGEWTKKLKETIARIQNQPIWVSASDLDEVSDDDSDDRHVDVAIQPQPFRQALIRDQSSGIQRRGRPLERMSKTTDDLPDVPDEIRNVLQRHMGADVQHPQHESRLRNQSVEDVLYHGTADLDHPHLEEASTVSSHSQHDSSHSSNSAGAKPKRSILKNKSQLPYEDSSGGDAESLTSSSAFRTRGRQARSPKGRVILIERANTAESPIQQQQQQHHQQQYVQPSTTRQQYIPQRPDCLSNVETEKDLNDNKSTDLNDNMSGMQEVNTLHPSLQQPTSKFQDDSQLMYQLMSEQLLVKRETPL